MRQPAQMEILDFLESKAIYCLEKGTPLTLLPRGVITEYVGFRPSLLTSYGNW